MIGPIYTLEEAAECLRMTRRSVAKTARKFGLCAISGRDLLFSEEDIKAIWEAKRAPAATGVSVAPVGHHAKRPGDAFESLLARATAKKPRRQDAVGYETVDFKQVREPLKERRPPASVEAREKRRDPKR